MAGAGALAGVDTVVLQFDALSQPELWIAAFAGGLFGAAIGALPAFIFTGFMVIAGEAANLALGRLADAGAIDAEAASIGITGSVAFGPVFGPHIAFAGGAAATAYAAKKGYMDTDFAYHEGKNIPYALGTHNLDVLAVGGLFGILGFVVAVLSGDLGIPWDPIAFAVVASAFLHRAAFGYDIFGTPKTDGGRMDMSAFDREETDDRGRFLTEPWLPHQYRWAGVATISLFAGVLGAFIALETGSPFLAFGISAASLVFLNCGVEKVPVTHHMTLPASAGALAALSTFGGMTLPLIVGSLFGLAGGLFGEVFQRTVYAHGDTHVDPPAAGIVFGTLLVALFALLGIFDSASYVPLP